MKREAVNAAVLFVLACLLVRATLQVVLAAPVVDAALAGDASGQLSQPQQTGKVAMTAMYFDLTGMQKDAQAQALDGAKRYLRSNVFPEKTAAILTYDGKAVVVRQDFTADLDRLGRVLDQIARNTSDIQPASDAARAAALQTAVYKLRMLSGQKNLVFFVAQPLVMDQHQLDILMEMALGANVSFFPIDVHGRLAPPLVRM